MRETCRQSLLAVAVVISAFMTIQPVLAQSSGVGCDGATRLLWRGTNASITLWKLDSNLNRIANATYGPYAGWSPAGITTACNNNTYALWLGLTVNGLAFNGAALIQQFDPNLNYVTQQAYGPAPGWIPESLSVDTSPNSTLRLIWRGGDTITGGTVSIWYLQPNLSVVRDVAYGPFPGFSP